MSVVGLLPQDSDSHISIDVLGYVLVVLNLSVMKIIIP